MAAQKLFSFACSNGSHLRNEIHQVWELTWLGNLMAPVGISYNNAIGIASRISAGNMVSSKRYYTQENSELWLQHRRVIIHV